MKKICRQISFFAMCAFLLFGFIASIVVAAQLGITIGRLNAAMGYLSGGVKIPNPAFGIFISGFIITLCVTVFWAFMLEHAKNTEKTLDTMYRESQGLPPLPDSAYSCLPSFLLGLTQPRPKPPVQYARPMQAAPPQYANQQYPQAVQPIAPAPQPAPVPMAQPVMPAPQPVPVQAAQPVEPAPQPIPVQAAQPVEPVPQPIPVQAAQPVEPVPQPVPVQAAQPVEPAPQPIPVQAAQPVEPVPQPVPVQTTQPVEPAPKEAPSEAWQCSCGAVNIPIAKFCSTCGKPRG